MVSLLCSIEDPVNTRLLIMESLQLSAYLLRSSVQLPQPHAEGCHTHTHNFPTPAR